MALDAKPLISQGNIPRKNEFLARDSRHFTSKRADANWFADYIRATGAFKVIDIRHSLIRGGSPINLRSRLTGLVLIIIDLKRLS
ncbi:hypothetical protein ACCQ12_10185 [Xanthomonas sp. NCPPB 1068]|uniref:hypothetical protein n=1 Tax=Xanthomonas sp. NCPPB 1068 TaxID=487525 RepID=UPI003556C645